jgi:hypothetical protein
MTLKELETTLPNGFHDADLLAVTRDYVNGTCVLELRVDLEGESAEPTRTVRILLTGVSLLVMEAPDITYPFSEICGEETSGLETTGEYFPQLPAFRERAPAGSFFYSFFLRGLNCFIHLAGTEARLL